MCLTTFSQTPQVVVRGAFKSRQEKRAAPPCNKGGVGTPRCRRGRAAGTTRIARVLGELKIQTSFVPRARSCRRTSGTTQKGAKGSTLTSHPATLRAGAGAMKPTLRPEGLAPAKRAKQARAPTVRTTGRCGARKQHPRRGWRSAWTSAWKSAMSANGFSLVPINNTNSSGNSLRNLPIVTKSLRYLG